VTLVRGLTRSLVLAALVAGIAPLPAPAVERLYSRGLYPRLQPRVTAVSSLVPVALLDVSVVLLLAGLTVAVARAWRRSGWRTGLRRLALLLIVVSASAYLWFLLFWGFNYRRVPLEDKLAYDSTRVRREQALTLARQAVDQANALVSATRSGNEDHELSVALADVERRLGATRTARVAEPKRSVLERYFRAAAIDGFTDPVFLEIVVNPDLLPFERPFVIAHEWAHLAGYANEAEANFIAWLTCIRASPSARYSGWLSAYQHVASVLPREDRLALRAALSPSVMADLAAASQRVARSSPTVRAAASNAYDAYLKANRIGEGVANYNAVVRLMVGTSFDAEWNPQLRQP
jgi:hypothetical protein